MRDGSTYRAARRNDWRAVKKVQGGEFPWPNFNTHAPKYQIGSAQHLRATMRSHVARSKFMPHIGNKERGRHA